MQARPVVQLEKPKPAAMGFTFGGFGQPSPTIGVGSGAAAAAAAGSSKEVHEDSLEFWLDGVAIGAAGDNSARAAVGEGELPEPQQPPVGLITLDKVRELAQKYRTNELPDFFPFRSWCRA
jgi:hypothetical protein